MKILICGSRVWDDPHPIYLVIAGWKEFAGADQLIVVHGAAPGADSLAEEMAQLLGVRTIPVPADWKTYGRAAGPIRNQKMLDDHEISVVYGFRAEGKSNGTEDMLRRAKESGLPTYLTCKA